MGDRRDMRDGVTTWTLGAGHSLSLSVLGVTRQGCSRSSSQDGFVGAGSRTGPGEDM